MSIRTVLVVSMLLVTFVPTTLAQTNRNYMQTLGFVTHELKAPLAAIQTIIATVVGGYVGKVPEKVAEFLRNCEELQDMVKNYLDLSRAERGELAAAKKNIDLRQDVVEPSVDQTAAFFTSRRMNLTVACPEKLQAFADAELVRIALTNYLTNAAKYGREGILASITVRADQGNIFVSVRNDGEGFTPDEASQLFEKFSRLKNENTRNQRGSGLGFSWLNAYWPFTTAKPGRNRNPAIGPLFISAFRLEPRMHRPHEFCFPYFNALRLHQICSAGIIAVIFDKKRRCAMPIEIKLQEMGLKLPPAIKPVANYVPAVRAGNLVFLSGHGPVRDDGKLITGKVGEDLTLEAGYQAARQVALVLLASLKAEIGDLDKVQRVVKLLGMVNCTPDFTDQPKVINGASDLLVALYGAKGQHARSAVGMNALPLNIAVEIEMIVEVEDQA
ncbi:MAG: hypothetical protein JSW39_25475 [Desulfobacterales bacterium]|nr:MAG: hypothetical protein JSW39_25475 [Desulfobacterales bacterium]